MNTDGDRALSISNSEKVLLDAKVYPRTITRLIQEYSEDRILQKAEHFTEGELVRAIEEDWQPRKSQGSAVPDYRPAGPFAQFWDDPQQVDGDVPSESDPP